MTRKELIAKIITTALDPGADRFAERLAAELDKIDQIKDSIRDAGRELEQHRRTFECKKKESQNIIAAIQSNCPHWDTTYHGDPAGGSDSHTRCNICGKVIE